MKYLDPNKPIAFTCLTCNCYIVAKPNDVLDINFNCPCKANKKAKASLIFLDHKRKSWQLCELEFEVEDPSDIKFKGKCTSKPYAGQEVRLCYDLTN